MWTLHISKQPISYDGLKKLGDILSSSMEWKNAGQFESLQAITAEIVQIEDLPVDGVFFQIHTSASYGTDEEFLSHLTFDGRENLYAVKKSRQ